MTNQLTTEDIKEQIKSLKTERQLLDYKPFEIQIGPEKDRLTREINALESQLTERQGTEAA